MEKRKKPISLIICSILTALILLQILLLSMPNIMMQLRVQLEAGRMWLTIMREYFTSEVVLYAS